MELEYLGHACFLITSANGTRIITDPYQRVGYELPENLTADIVTVSHGHFDHNYISGVSGQPIIIDKSGDFQVYGITFHGEDTYHDDHNGALRGKNIVYSFTVDGVRCCHLGDLGEPWREDILNIAKGVDLLMIPVGGTYTIDALQANIYIKKLKPRMAVLMHFKGIGGTIDIASKEAVLSKIDGVKELGNRLSILPKNTDIQDTEIYIMKRTGE